MLLITPVDNASSGIVVIVDPSLEQSVTPGVDFIVIRMTMITVICFTYGMHSLYLYFDCTYSIKNKNVNKPFERDFLKIAKINSQQEKPLCPNCKN